MEASKHFAETMPLPFHVSCDLPGAKLFELSDGRFQQIEPGKLAPWYAMYRCLLVDPALADLLMELDMERVSFEPAVVFDPVAKREHRPLVRVRVGQFFVADQIRDLPLDGPRLLTMGDIDIFASPALRERLNTPETDYLQFSEGLAGFAA